MDQDKVRAKLQKIGRYRDYIDSNEETSIVEALNAGVRQMDIAADVRRTREYVRRIARAHGIQAGEA